MVSSRVRVSVSFIFFLHFSFPIYVKKRKLVAGQVPPWLSAGVFGLHYVVCGFGYGYLFTFFTFLKVFFFIVSCKLGLRLVLSLRSVLWLVLRLWLTLLLNFIGLTDWQLPPDWSAQVSAVLA